MSQRERVLDALAWSGITEKARIARLASSLIRQGGPHTQASIKDAIRETAPPYGRAKHIFQALYGTPRDPNDEDDKGVEGEINRQREIFDCRQKEQNDWAGWLNHRSRRATRLNYAYAAAFDRPLWEPNRECPIVWSWEMGYDSPIRKAQYAWECEEGKRDKGDVCMGLTHQGGYVVCLAKSIAPCRYTFVATRLRKGPVVRTPLRDCPVDLSEAAVSFGGPKVLSAIAKGKRVKTDWVGRRSFIHHDGSDYEEPKIEEVSWSAAELQIDDLGACRLRHVVIHGDIVSPAG